MKIYARKIRKWAEDRKIIPNSSLSMQNIKLAEEFGELALGVRKEDVELIKDSVGDIFVVATIMAGLEYIKIEDLEFNQQAGYYNKNKDNLKYSFMWLQNSIGEVAKSIIRQNLDVRKLWYVNIINDLMAFCEWKKISFIDCIVGAYNEIKDRRGYLNENGIFIKEEDYK